MCVFVMCTCILYTHIRINSGYNGTDVVPNREVIVHVMLGRDVYWHKHHTPSATSGKYTHAGVELPRLPPGVLADVYTPTSSWQSSRTLSIEAGYVRSCVCVSMGYCLCIHATQEHTIARHAHLGHVCSAFGALGELFHAFRGVYRE
jgi:hypothetical protein